MLNKVTLIGHIGADLGMVTFENGDQIAKASIATTEHWKDKESGEKKSKTEWHYLILPNRTKNVWDFIKKGSKLFVEGKLRTRFWETPEGDKKYITEISVYNIVLLDSKPEGSAAKDERRSAPDPVDSSEDDLPF